MHSGGELGMVGTTYRRAGQTGIAAFTLSPAQLADPHWPKAFAQEVGVDEAVYLATCNRVEIFFVTAPGVDVAACRERIFAYFAKRAAPGVQPLRHARQLHAFAGDGAIERLFVVASALDAMVPGEAQVLGQVKAAYASAVSMQLAGPRLRPIFAAAFAAAKQVRQLTALGEGRTSMLSLAMDLIDAQVARVASAKDITRPAQVVVVGAGDMAQQCAKVLGGRDDLQLVFVNRTLPRAQALAEQCGGTAVALDTYLRAPQTTDLMLTATAAPKPLFDAPFFAALPAEAALIIDLAVPRDVVPEAALAHGAALYDVDRMQKVAQRHADSRRQAVAQARAVLDDALDAYRRQEAERDMGRAIAAVRAQGEAMVAQHLQQLRAQMPAEAYELAWPHIERFARALWGKLAHTSTRGLKALAHEHGAEALACYLRGADINLQTPRPQDSALPRPSMENLS